jgi:hypothetical protein
MRREMVWVRGERFMGRACSECAWVFSPSGSPVGTSLEQMKQHFESRRDREVASHVCAEYPRAPGQLGTGR